MFAYKIGTNSPDTDHIRNNARGVSILKQLNVGARHRVLTFQFVLLGVEGSISNNGVHGSQRALGRGRA